MMESIAWITVVNLALYLKTLRYKFVSDDYSVFNNPPKYKNRWHKRWLQITGQGKWAARSINFYKENGKWKVAVINTGEQEHLIALLVHIAICISIYFGFGPSQVSFVAALFYSVNPVNNQATIWPAGRSYAFSILFLLLAMIIPYAGPVFLYCAAWYTAGFLPPLALIGSKIWWLIGFMPIIWFLHSKKWTTAIKSKRQAETFTEDRVVHPRKLILFTKTLGFYFLLCLIPFRITFYHNFLQSAAGSMKHKCYTFCRYFWVGFAFICGMIAYSVLVPWNTLSWALYAFFITILPFCNFVRSTQEIAERFTALPNIFLMYALAQVIYKI